MKTIALAFGREQQTLEIPSDRWQVLKKDLPALSEKSLNDAVHELFQILRVYPPKSKILLVVPDHTRKCRLDQILPALLQTLQHRFTDIEILIANGSHVVQPEAKIRELVSAEIFDYYPVFQHDAKDERALVTVGKTSYGTTIQLNKKTVEADVVVTIGGVLYHYFAGFGGGAKMLMPGVAGYESIRTNHSLSIDRQNLRFHPECREGNIWTNPIYLDCIQVLQFMPNVHSLQVAVAPDGQLIYCEAGSVLETQRKIIRTVEKLYSMPISGLRDVVIADAGGFPGDVNLIQVHKSLHHAFQAVKTGGTIILLASCSEGVGSKTFEPFLEAISTEEMAEWLAKDFQLNGQTALALREKTKKAKIILVSSLPQSVVEKTEMIFASNLAEAIKKSGVSQDTSTYILKNANYFVPTLRRETELLA